MSIGRVAFVPSAPLLVPAVAGGSAGLDEAMRAASVDVVARAVGNAPDEVVVVAAVPAAGDLSPASSWDFAGFGVARHPPLSEPALPWPLGIGAWLLDEAGWAGPRRYVGAGGVGGVGDSVSPAGSTPLARTTSVVVVGDGSACRSEKAPGHLDQRAEPFDDAVADLLARGDAAGLGRLDAALADELLCAGLPAWRWTVAALDGATPTAADLVMHVSPYGVGYFVALWTFA